PIIDLSRLLRSFTSVYQLLPTYACYNSGTGDLLHVDEADGIPNLDKERAKAALDFHREIAKAVDSHLKEDEYLKNRYQIYPIVGIKQPTLQSARLNSGKVEILSNFQGEDD